MKKIILIRHGKASKDFSCKDFDRPLLLEGIENSKLVARTISTYLLEDLIVWSSAAKRASETALTVLKTIDKDINLITFKEDLYTFDAQELADIIKSCSNEVKNLLIFGHNSAISDFVNKFGHIYIENVPTSGLVAIEFNTKNWSSISNGKTIETLFPSQLK